MSLFNTLMTRAKEEVMAGLLAEPTPYVRKKLEADGWRFVDAEPYRDERDEFTVSCLLIFNPKGEYVMACDAFYEHPTLTPKTGGMDEYYAARRAVLNSIGIGGKSGPRPV